MKTTTLALMTAIIPIAGMHASAAPGNGNNAAPSNDSIPSVPIGVMSANPQQVQTGTYPTLSWSIVYPTSIQDVLRVDPPGTIIIDDPNVYVSVRPIGVGPTECVAGEDKHEISVDMRVSLNGGGYQQMFYGSSEDIDPSTALYVKKLGKGSVLNFGGRYVKNGSWTPFYTTNSSNMQVLTLSNGDEIPTTFDLLSNNKLASYLKPYINGQGKVKVGPLSLLVVMELAGGDHNSLCYDYQDAVLLVTFSRKHPNNGHGNNQDGVDISNPGKGSGGPNGAVDVSAGFDDPADWDDEIK